MAECGLDYNVGNSFGIYPANDAALVDAVLAALEAPADFPIGGRTLREALTDGVSLSPAPDMLFQLISYLTGGDRRQKAKALAAGRGTRTATRRCSTCSPPCRNFPASGPIRKPSSNRSIPCSRASIRSPRR